MLVLACLIWIKLNLECFFYHVVTFGFLKVLSSRSSRWTDMPSIVTYWQGKHCFFNYLDTYINIVINQLINSKPSTNQASLCWIIHKTIILYMHTVLLRRTSHGYAKQNWMDRANLEPSNRMHQSIAGM